MNRSYSKIRNINSVNYLLEQKYLEDKRNTDRGVLVEQEEDYFFNNTFSSYSDKSANKDYRLLNEQPLQTYGVSQAAVNAILAVSKKNKQALRGSMLAPLQQREIDKQFGVGTFDKFYENGGKDLLAGKKPKETNIGWGKYPCVFFTNPQTKIPMNDGSFAIEIGSTIYYGGGRKKSPDGKMSNYYCGGKDNLEIKEGVPEILVGWENYPCVTSNSTAKKIQLKDGTVAYDINGEIYYGGGRKKGLNGQMSNYYCDGTNIKDGDKPSSSQTETNNQSSSQTSNTNTTTTSGGDFGTIYPNVFTPNVLSTIRAKIGSNETSQTLTQTDINLLYTAIDSIK
jgi:hypothetical protein